MAAIFSPEENLGKTVLKHFPNYGYFFGIVVGFDPPTAFYKVKYDDGDEEELEEGELQEILLKRSRPFRKVVKVRVGAGLNPLANGAGRVRRRRGRPSKRSEEANGLQVKGEVKGKRHLLDDVDKVFQVEYECGQVEFAHRAELLEILVGENLQNILNGASLTPRGSVDREAASGRHPRSSSQVSTLVTVGEDGQELSPDRAAAVNGRLLSLTAVAAECGSSPSPMAMVVDGDGPAVGVQHDNPPSAATEIHNEYGSRSLAVPVPKRGRGRPRKRLML